MSSLLGTAGGFQQMGRCWFIDMCHRSMYCHSTTQELKAKSALTMVNEINASSLVSTMAGQTDQTDRPALIHTM